MRNPFRYFNSSPEVIRLTVMMYLRYPLSLRQVEDLLFERGIDICHETVRFWWNRFGPLFAAEIRKRRVPHSSYSKWRWHLGRGLREDQRGDALSVAGGGSRRRGAGSLCDAAPGSQAYTGVSEAGDEAPWPTEGHRQRRLPKGRQKDIRACQVLVVKLVRQPSRKQRLWLPEPVR